MSLRRRLVACPQRGLHPVARPEPLEDRFHGWAGAFMRQHHGRSLMMVNTGSLE